MAVGIKLVALEKGHHADVLHTAILHDGVEDNLPVGIHILQFVPGDGLQELRHGEDGPRTKPTAHVVAAHMIEHRVVGNREDIVLQLLQVSYAHDFLLGLRVAEDEVAEAEMLCQQVAQVNIHLLRVLVHEGDAVALGALTVLALRTLHDHRDVFIVVANGFQQPETCFGIFLGSQSATLRTIGLMSRETAVTDDAQRIVGIFLIDAPGLIIGTCQHHLRTASHSERCRMGVQCLRSKALALGKDVTVQIGQHRRIEADGVFHEQNHLHACLLDVMLQVHAVLYQFDDGENQIGIAQPAEHVVEDTHILVLHAAGNTV